MSQRGRDGLPLRPRICYCSRSAHRAYDLKTNRSIHKQEKTGTMKVFHRSVIPLSLLLVLSPALAVAQETGSSNRDASERLVLTMSEDARIWVEGTSTVRGFECRVNSFTAEGSVTTNVSLAVESLNEATADIVLEIPVANLDCGNGTMNDHMRKALKADQYPTIRYRHTGHSVVLENGTSKLRLEGMLSISGEERPITMTTDVSVAEESALRVQGRYEINLRDYKIEPPKLMFGTLKVGDIVTVRFDIALNP